MAGYRSSRTPEQRAAYLAYLREYRRTNRDALLARKKAAYEANRESRLKSMTEYRKNMDRGARRAYMREWDANRRRDPVAGLAVLLRRRLYMAIKNGQKGGSAIALLGCSIPALKAHLESLFQPGMSWENRGRKGWHIDHIRPLSAFDLTDPEQCRAACHYTNLQPLWALDNQRKSARPSSRKVADTDGCA
jgi:hypothetical protein